MLGALELMDAMHSRAIPVSPESVDKTDKTDKTQTEGILTPDKLIVLRKQAADLHTRIIFLRCRERTEKADRPALIQYLTRRIDALAAHCDTTTNDGSPAGWQDPDDEFADECDQLTILRMDLAELTRPDAPYPLGDLTDDPFTMDPPRLYNGVLA